MTDIVEKRLRPERYVSFKGIDCAGNACRVMDYVRGPMAEAASTKAFWEHVRQRLASGVGPKQDDMPFVHVYLNQIREMFEERKDSAALALLEQIEEECC